MALFDRQPARDDDEVIASSDAATRALSVADLENSFVERVYDKLASLYDLTYGPLLHPGRLQALKLMTINPARLVGLDNLGIGRLAVGVTADITVIDPGIAWTIDVSEFKTAGRNCPFHGWKVTGKAIGTIVSGEIRRWAGETERLNRDAQAGLSRTAWSSLDR